MVSAWQEIKQDIVKQGLGDWDITAEVTFELRQNAKDGANVGISDESWLSRQKGRLCQGPKPGPAWCALEQKGQVKQGRSD